MKVIRLAILIILALSVMSCNNYFHDLIPPDGNRILSFTVERQLDMAVISDNSIITTVDVGCDVSALIPNIKVSPKATLFPLTIDYLKETFPNIDIFEAAVKLYEASDLAAYVEDLIRKNPGFKVPVLDKPIDFSGPVNFIVMSGQGSIRQYSVRIIQDNGEPMLLGIRFSKYDNPDLMSDALCYIDEKTKTVYAYAKFPAEMGYTSFPLIPSFEILGDKLEVNGTEIISGVNAVDFNAPSAIPQYRTIKVYRNGLTADYSLVVYFEEDKDTVRSITDFRFTKEKNPGISVTAVGSIINNDNFGTITVQVYYSGAKPDNLIASFVTPGTVTVNGASQVTGVTGNDFSSQKEYRVTSRNGLYIRTYTVRVEFINISADAPRITSFIFSQRLNENLVQDSVGVIGNDFIMLDVCYGSNSAPYDLIPEFSAGGIVTVSGSVQVSGASQQNYSKQIKYTVTNPEHPILTRDYWVQIRFVQDYSSSANITAFGFYPEENTSLYQALEAKIDQTTGRITIMAPTGSGLKSKLMIPRFTAAGTIKVNNVVQTSGVSAQMYTWSVTYTVTSANGRNTRTYEVILRELSSPIFVNYNAAGMNDGTNWENAFTSLKTACEAAADFPNEMEKEIWIARGTYKPSDSANIEDFLIITPNTSYLGGFEGWETNKTQRTNPNANRPLVSGDLGGGKVSMSLFATGFDNINDYISVKINGNILFEYINFSTWTRDNSQGYSYRLSSAISTDLSNGNKLKVLNCNFDNKSSFTNGYAILLYNEDYYNNGGNFHLEVDNIIVNDCYDGIYFVGGSNKSTLIVRNSEFINIARLGNAIATHFAGDITIDNVKMENFGVGLNLAYVADGSFVRISNCDIKYATNDTFSSAIYFSGSGRNVVEINNTVIENSNNVRGIDLSSNETVTLSNVIIKNSRAAKDGYGGGVYWPYVTSLTIKDSLFENCTAEVAGGAIYPASSPKLTIINTQFINCYP